MARKHLFIGFGDISSRCARELAQQGDEIVGICRSQKTSEVAELWCGDVKSKAMLARVRNANFDTAVITLSPDGYDEAAYRATYFDCVAALVALWSEAGAHPPQRIIFVSSTSVYAQAQGQVVDEDSETAPSSATAKVLLETELRLLSSSLGGIVLRFSGIYGPGRDYLLRQVWQGKKGNDSFSNRIHVEDCCGSIIHLLNIREPKDIYLASDSSPVKGSEIRAWLAEQLGTRLSVEVAPSSRGGNKKCCNQRLLDSGYTFFFADYKSGYRAAIDLFLAQQKSLDSP